MKKLMTAAVITAVACGCISVNKNDGGESNLRPCVLKDRIYEKYSVADKTVSAQDQVHCLFGFITWGSSATHTADQTDDLLAFGMKAKAKNGAYANACDAAKCDQLVATRYKITTTDYYVYANCKAEVTGYPATVKGVEVVPPCAVKCMKDGCCPKK